jgi:uncharacterized metal-binding protein (TIGR02443 family)
MDLEQTNCPYCKSSESMFWATENGYTAVKCVHCGFVYVNPRPDLGKISEAAKIGLHGTSKGEISHIGNFRRYRVSGFKTRVNQLFSGGELTMRVIRWLDVGAGFGELLLALQELAHVDSTIMGIEPCEPKLKKARQLGLNISNLNLDQITDTYDYVSLVNVFSHLPDPCRFISAIRKIITPGGEIMLVTGNGGDIKANEYLDTYLLPDHLVFAGEKHIIGMLERGGFELVGLQRYDNFLPENIFLSLIKAVGRGSSTRPRGPFRSLWVRGRLKSI